MTSFDIKLDKFIYNLPQLSDEDEKLLLQKEKEKIECEIKFKYATIKNKSGIPPRYKQASLIDFDENIVKQYHNALQSILTGEAILIHSQIPGSGKTHFACAIMRSIILNDEIEALKTNKINFCSGIIFLTAPDFMLILRDTIKSENISEMSAMSIYKNCDILILDDYGAENYTQYSAECIYSIINYRYNNNKITIVTTNLSLAALKDRDSRIYSRVSSGIIIQMPDKNWRKKS
ncbi:MAG: hypothetical protein EHM12_11235 [Dehalococcoidia bacterium]|nr:MAG: hypothetical protein EHM12_11235 [Dehalococcoidia bacterium]